MSVSGIPLGETAALIALGEPRQRFVWSGGTRTEQREISELGQPISTVTGLICTGFGMQVEATVELTDQLATGISSGDVIELTGKLTLSISGTRDGYETRQNVTGITETRSASTLSELVAEVLAR